MDLDASIGTGGTWSASLENKGKRVGASRAQRGSTGPVHMRCMHAAQDRVGVGEAHAGLVVGTRKAQHAAGAGGRCEQHLLRRAQERNRCGSGLVGGLQPQVEAEGVGGGMAVPRVGGERVLVVLRAGGREVLADRSCKIGVVLGGDTEGQGHYAWGKLLQTAGFRSVLWVPCYCEGKAALCV